MINRSSHSKPKPIVQKKSTARSSDDGSEDSNEDTSSGTAESGTSSDSESEMDTTETSFSSKSATECGNTGGGNGPSCKGQLQGQQGLLRMNNRNYAVYCGGEADTKNSKHFCNHHHHHHHHHGDEESKKEVNCCRSAALDQNARLVHRLKKAKKTLPISICILNCRYDIITRVCKRLGYRLVGESDLWNVCWTDSFVGVDFCRDMRRFQKVNHFPGMFEICRKDLLARNLNRMLKLFPLDYQIFPKTWCFPADLGDAVAYSRTHRSKTFILKPDQGSQGKGIFLTKNLKEINPKDRMICQVYITKPLLIDGYKFDLRVYTLITSTDPLRIFVYNEGLARFATNKYKEPCVTNASNTFMHLTNYSVNKYSRTFSNDDEAGSKRRFSTLNRILTSEGYDIAELWSNIDDVIVKTVMSAWPMLKHTYTASFPTHDIIQACFEVLGFDILIDHKLKPYVLEVNHSPSFHTDEAIDKEIKEALITDTFIMLNLNGEVKKRVLEEDKRRIQNRLLQRLRDYSKQTVSKDQQQQQQQQQQGQQGQQGGQQQQGQQQQQGRDANDPDDDGYGEEGMGPWAEQINWEETHLGGYRRILPAPGDPNRYLQFFIAQSQASVYNETAASKRREECAKQQRIELEERFRLNQAILHKHNPKLQKGGGLGAGEDAAGGNGAGGGGAGGIGAGKKKLRKRKVAKVAKKHDEFMPDQIADYEERERMALLGQRDFLIRTCGLVQSIYINFHRNKLLTDSDRRKYKETYAKLITNEHLPQSESSPQSNHTFSTIHSTSTVAGSTSTGGYHGYGGVTAGSNSNTTTCLPSLGTAQQQQQQQHSSGSSSSTNQLQKLQIKSLVAINDVTSWMQCTEVPVQSRPPLPYLLATQPTNYRSTKSTMARQVTNVVKRHSMESRQYYTSDKLI
ncbi:tubulin polyglutamylase TTLL13-like isoform X1 [Anopheles arabiensis]|uniref:tubulin polyglutamylase TTLL13-like isoform X1 n=1 Tax=Anopheles arabiensis TaxID=7173 RepID=UPI001AACED5B|nr:tubulin polyglutamylase TTLL13-like isoform X1 [Anopheles arabiensis]